MTLERIRLESSQPSGVSLQLSPSTLTRQHGRHTVEFDFGDGDERFVQVTLADLENLHRRLGQYIQENGVSLWDQHDLGGELQGR